ncbi:MAG: hypothetical protein HQK75_12200 [Candidatus Magnetomorum sp.]|nr:hypothetical protein [Candidatus Magnetomorum sp.]
MDILSVFKIFQTVMAITAFFLAITTGALLWRYRGLMRWRRSLTKELKLLKMENRLLEGPQQKAQDIVIKTCEQIQQAFMADIKVFEQLADYICQIAACYHPEKDHPEQCITIGNSLYIIQEIAFRIDQLLKQPGLNRFRKMRLRHITQIYERLKRLQKNSILSFYLKYRKIIQKISLIRLFILPDPFSWMFYISNQFTVITLTRYLLLEIYFYTGRLAVYAYGQSSNIHKQVSFSQEELEALMLDLEQFQAITSNVDILEINMIRKKNLGFAKGLLSDLSVKQWKQAVMESAQVIAVHHFPDSSQPLMEVSVGPLLERSRYWIKTINKIQSIPVVDKMVDVKIEVIFQAKVMIDNVPPKLKQTIASTMKFYRWAKWPILIYRLAQKMTPIGIATSLGWMVTQKSLLFYGYQYTFYLVCDELNVVYMLSLNDQTETKE